MRNFFYVLGILGITTAVSCKKERASVDESNISKIAPNGFNYKTANDVTLNLKLLSNTNEAVGDVVVSVYTSANAKAGDAIFKGITNDNGDLTATINVAAGITQLYIDPAYTGLMRNAKAAINNNKITATIGGTKGYSGDIIPDDINTSASAGSGSGGGVSTFGLNITEFAYPAPYTSSLNAVVDNGTYPFGLGRPKYLETTPDVIDASLLSYINTSLPEYQPVSSLHPEYLSSTAVSNINVKSTTDVWVTYVSEGAGYQSTLAYYTYNTSNPPAQTFGGTNNNGVDKVTIVFPNASGTGSGGGLKSGDKVKLGTFSAGTTIAFVLMQNSWLGTGINLATQRFYSDSRLNPEINTALKKHSVLLYDNLHKIYLFGFEDTNRETAAVNPKFYAADNDFNDLVFYVTANPVSGISNQGVSAIDSGGDRDGDGVLDVYDAFPTDPTRAYVYYFPSENTFAQIAFEDNWPVKGDYDMNDLVVNYRYMLVLNAKAEILTLQGDFSIAASGASYHNGFGVQLPFAASTVKSVTGQQTIGNYIQFASNGVEAGQSKAVIIPFDNHEALLHYPDFSYLINTLNEKDKAQSATATVLVTFNSPVSTANLSMASINPFTISDTRRGYEIHLPGYEPTDKANKALFGTQEDASLINGRLNYTSKENWPWAINFNSPFKYPLERVKITDAYPHFTDWAGSNGGNFQDWYSNLTSGYLVSSNIYSK